MSEVKLFLDAVSKREIKTVYMFLKSNNLRLETAKNAKDHTAFHIVALNGDICLLNLFIDFVITNKIKIKNAQDYKEILHTLANLKTDEGFTPAHFASFHGNYVKLT